LRHSFEKHSPGSATQRYQQDRPRIAFALGQHSSETALRFGKAEDRPRLKVRRQARVHA
jgi:hypothetical protein